MKRNIAPFIALALMLGLCSCFASQTPATWQGQYDLGIQYLSEGSYQEAAIAFAAAIEIDSNRAEAYEGLADTYLAQRDTAAALQALNEGVAATGSSVLQARIDGITVPILEPSEELTDPLGASSDNPATSLEPTSPLEDTGKSDDGYSGSCGNDVRWRYDPDSHTLTISGHGNMYHYSPYRGIGSPYDQYREDIMNLVIQDGVTGIGDFAFFWFTNLNNMTMGTSVTIPESVTSMGDSAFYFCERLANITILGNIASIGDDTFSGCSHLTDITIPSSVTSIGDRAFADCTELTDIYYTGTQEQWAAIGTGLVDNESLSSATIHYNCMANCDFTIENGVLIKYNGNGGDVIIPSSVTSIGDDAFAWCAGITSVTIPESVTAIRMNAFLWCIELKDVYYTGTEAQWKSIDINEYAFAPDPTAVTIHYNSTK